MPGTDYSRQSAAEQEKAILGLSASTWPWDVRESAMRGILSFNEIQVDAIKAGRAGTVVSVGNFAAYTTTLAGYLNVPMPAVPADLSGLKDAERLALAQALDLAFWDWLRRKNALDTALVYYRQVVSAGGAAPTITAFRDTFLGIANSVRAQRGLPDISV